LQQIEITLDESNPERTLKWELNGKTGRQIGFTPFFSDGRYLYVLSYRHEPEFDENTHLNEVPEVIERLRNERNQRAAKNPYFAFERFDPERNFAFVDEVVPDDGRHDDNRIRRDDPEYVAQTWFFSSNGKSIVFGIEQCCQINIETHKAEFVENNYAGLA